MPKDVCTIELPDAGTTQVLKLEPGQVNTLSFAADSIVTSRMTADGAVEMDLVNGSKIIIENFQDLAYSNESCGRDTIIQLSDNSIIYPEELFTTLVDAQNAADVSPAAGVNIIGVPVEMIGEVNIVPGENYQLGFELSDIENMKQSGDDLVITFNDGQVLTLNDFYTAFDGDLPPAMTLADGTVVTPDSIFSEYSDAMASQNAADIEPAAGTEPVAQIQQVANEISPQEAQEMAEAALEAAEIEPAAGVNPGTSGSRGYGFQSITDAATLNSQDATGPIGPTALAYQQPELREVTPQDDNTVAVVVDDQPILTAASNAVDESNPRSVNGIINVDYGNDGPGTVTAKDASTFTFGGSVAGGALTSKGEAVTVSQSGNVFTGTSADGRTIFTLTIESDGRYNFTLLDQLDHADATNPNDVIDLGFGIQATDDDGDMSMSTLTIRVFDDGPRAADDTVNLDDVTNVATGNVLFNDNAGFDEDASVIAVSFNGTTVNVPANGSATIMGQYGTLVINSDGSYTYTRTSTVQGADNFTYTMRDSDGDTDDAVLYVTLERPDDIPNPTPPTSTVDESDPMPMVQGQITTDFGQDGPGSYAPKDVSQIVINGSVAGGSLTSKGEPVVITLNGNTYTATAGGRDVFTMTINPDGTYKFTLLDQLDHADGTNPDDQIDIQFGVVVTDADGDMVMTSVTIEVRDDVPTAVDDVNSVPDNQTSVTGNILTNDDPGFDEPMSLVKVSFNGTDYVFTPGTTSFSITGVYGVLNINSDGSYTYTRSGTAAGTDVFGYMIRDNDGDMDSATLTIDVVEGDRTPVVVNATNTVDETNYDGKDFTVTGTVDPNYFNDGPGTVTAKDGSFNATGSLLNGNLTSHGEAITVTLNGNTFIGATAAGREVFTLTVNPDGTYSFTARDQIDHADGSNPNDVISLQFGVTATDADGDMGMGTITINVRDDAPVLGDSQRTLDESNLDSGNVSVSGQISGDYGEDGPGMLAANNNVSASSPSGPVTALSSEGAAVTISQTSTGYVGTTAAGTTVFELFFNPATGAYTFTQYAPLDHPNAGNPNDPLTLNFGYTISDFDGDSDTGTISITILDDGPVAADDTLSVNELGTASGNVLTNDDLGEDLGASRGVISVEHNGTTYTVPATGTATIVGQYGTLVIGANGQYTYTANNVNVNQVDEFTYTYRDSDGDTSSASLDITVVDRDTIPTIQDSVCTTDETFLWAGSPSGGVISLDNTIVANFRDDAPGTFAFNGTSSATGSVAGGTLTSNGSPITFQITDNTIVAVSADGRTIFETTLNMTTGEYHTDVYDVIDHADGTNPNDLISLSFGVDAIDSDGDRASANVVLNIYDDAPIAQDDGSATVNGSVSGNVLTNDYLSQDEPTPVIKVTFNGTDYSVPATGTATIVGQYGTLVIGANGAYTYTSNNTGVGTDNFTYMIRDYDGDMSTADLDLSVGDVDTNPIATEASNMVDETNMLTASGTVNVDYQADGPGTVSATNAASFSSDGSLLGGALTSRGAAVNVTLNGNTYTGTAGGRTVFTLVINANGTYTFTQMDQLDHADPTNPNDVINLHFGYRATDSDGDTADSRINIAVKDDGPTAVNDTISIPDGAGSGTGNVLTNDSSGFDDTARVIKVTFNGTDYNVNPTVTTVIQGQYGTLEISHLGGYVYTPKNNVSGTDTFTYMIRDYDGDTATAKLDVNVSDVDTVPTIDMKIEYVDETNLDTGAIMRMGSFDADFKDDAPGTYAFNGTVMATRDTNGTALNLTSNGMAVNVAVTATGITGTTADGRTIFTATLNQTTGQYVFKLIDTIDHPDATNPNDVIWLKFGVDAIDADGDRASTFLQIDVADDGPIARDDGNSTVNTSVSGNVLTNDELSEDAPTPVVKVTFNGTDYNVPATGTVSIAGVHGTLVIGANGQYTYTSNNTTTGTDRFTYMIRDYDGDTSTANLDLTVGDIDTVPTVQNSVSTTDETFLWSGSPSGGVIDFTNTIVADFKADGPGTFKFTGTSNVSGSVAGGTLTSNGSAVSFQITDTSIRAVSADGRTIFETTLNPNTGEYRTRMYDTIDHANTTNPNDLITFRFGVMATDSDGDSANANVILNVYDDGPIAQDDGANAVNGSVSGNVLVNDYLSQDEPTPVVKVTFNGTDYNVPSTGSASINGVYGTLVIRADGSYTYTANNSGTGIDNFTYMIRDYDGDTSTAKLSLAVNDIDTVPIATVENAMVDETNMRLVTGNVDVDYKADGPGTVSATSAGSFSSDGSLLGGALTSKGQAVNVTLNGNTYTGTAGGREVFTLEINANGYYTFTLKDQLDHADKNNPNDIINLHFGYRATDTDGDTATSTINIAVKDDAPIARDDTAAVPNGSDSVSGNVLTNDTSGFDDNATVIRVSFNGTDYTVPTTGTQTIVGQFGTLVIRANGSFTYTSKNTTTGTDNFTYMIKDHDGDMAQANLNLTVGDIDTVPTVENSICTTDETFLWAGSPSGGVIDVTNTIIADFKADAPGTFKFNGSSSVSGSVAGGTLTSHGSAVTFQITNTTIKAVSADGRTIFESVLNPNTGTYRTQVYDTLDHANGSNPNDLITFNFGVTVTDSDGDTATANVILQVYDDAPIAQDDGGNTVNGTISGNVLVNDYLSQDESTIVTKVTFNGTDYSVPANGTRSVSGVYGTLSIKADGSYTYTSKNTGTGVDNFTYTIRDYDGDTSSAKLGFAVNDIDTTPIATNSAGEVDETATRTYNGTVNVDYQADGPGMVMPTNANSFSANGSLLGGALTSKGQAVTVTLSGDTYTGTAGGREVFTLKINANSTYTFTLKDQLDHADGANANDIINLNFGYKAVDTDGDTASATITIAVKDDVPVARDDTGNIPNGATTTSGNVLTNDVTGYDEGITVSKVTFNGTDYSVPGTGTRTVSGTYGTLVIKADGSYTYTTKNTATGTDHFTYMIKDHDGDTSTASLNLTVQDTDAVPTITTSICTTDETFLSPGSPSGGIISLTNTVVVDYGGDGPGTLAFTGSFQAVGSLKNGALTSEGYPVNVNVTANSVTGTSSDGRTIFTISLNQSTGAYSVRVYDTLDHADGANKNDLIKFNIGIKATDSDGDVGTGTVVLEVYDDAPIAVNDGVGAISPNQGRVDGNVFANDYLSVDGTKLTNIRWASTANHNVGSAGFALIGMYGTLYIYQNGAYTYIAKNSGQGTDTFTYTMTDGDGDTATAQLSVLVQNGGAQTLSSSNFVASTSNVSGSEFVADDDTSTQSSPNHVQNLSASDPAAMDSSEVLKHDFVAQPEGRTVIAGTNAADTIQGSDADEVIEGKGGSDNIHAGAGDDVIYGGAGNDVIYGDDGADIIFDGAGADVVHGGAGDDILVVGGQGAGETGLDGANELWGDGGADTFLFAQGSQVGLNTIRDFNTAEGDVVDLSDFLHNYDPLTQSIDAFVFQRETANGTVISVDVNGTGNVANAVDIVALDNVRGQELEDIVLNAQKVQDAA